MNYGDMDTVGLNINNLNKQVRINICTSQMNYGE